ncbi:MAG: lytic transglycosylase domain-containing protein [Deltaproteobacteria bacterium]|nr:lytic transglycosylase domain-containing protein [Deltaproteobacteria bacterium]
MVNAESAPPPGPLFPPPAYGEEPAWTLMPKTPAVPEEKPPDRPFPSLERQEIDSRIKEAAAKHGVDADLIRAVIEVESRFDPQAVSPVGARGLMQLMPATSADLGVRNPFDPGQNIEGGTRYLKQLLGRYGGNRRLALAAYNWGLGNLEKRPEALPLETRRYLVRVEKAYQRYAGETRTPAVGLG